MYIYIYIYKTCIDSTCVVGDVVPLDTVPLVTELLLGDTPVVICQNEKRIQLVYDGIPCIYLLLGHVARSRG